VQTVQRGEGEQGQSEANRETPTAVQPEQTHMTLCERPSRRHRARSLQSLAHCGHDEVVGLEVTTTLVGVLIGVIIGRWWSILFALPAGLVAQSMYSFEGFSDTGVAVLFGIAVAIGLALGVLVRKGIVRWVSEGAVFWRRGS
jgi:hypothetical protein